MFGDPSKHAWTNFFVVVKCEDEIRPRGAFKRSMGAGLAFDPPADSQESSEDSVRFGGWPVAQAA